MELLFLTVLAVAYLVSKSQVDRAAYENGHEPASVERARLRHANGGGGRAKSGRPKGPGALRLLAASQWANACEMAKQRGDHWAARRRAWYDETAPFKDEEWQARQYKRLLNNDERRSRWASHRGLKVEDPKASAPALLTANSKADHRRPETEGPTANPTQSTNSVVPVGKSTGEKPVTGEAAGPGTTDAPKTDQDTKGPSTTKVDTTNTADTTPKGTEPEAPTRPATEPSSDLPKAAGVQTPDQMSASPKPQLTDHQRLLIAQMSASSKPRLTDHQRHLIDQWRKNPITAQISAEEWFKLPVMVRVALVRDAWKAGCRPVHDRTGEALAQGGDPEVTAFLKEYGLAEPPELTRAAEAAEAAKAASHDGPPTEPQQGASGAQKGQEETGPDEPTATGTEKAQSSETGGTAKSAVPNQGTEGSNNMYTQAVTQLVAAANAVNEFGRNLTSFADSLEGQGWGVEVTGVLKDMHGQVVALEGQYYDLAVRMGYQGGRGREAYDQAPWVPGPEVVLR